MSLVSLEGDNPILCRLCLKFCDRSINIFNPDGTNGLLLWEIIKELLQLDVCQGDGLPKTICHECLRKVADFKYFKTMCIKSRIEFLKMMAVSGLVQNDVPDLSLPKFLELKSPGPPEIKFEPVGMRKGGESANLTGEASCGSSGMGHTQGESPLNGSRNARINITPAERGNCASPLAESGENSLRALQAQKRSSNSEGERPGDEPRTGGDSGEASGGQMGLRSQRLSRQSDAAGASDKERQLVEGYGVPLEMLFKCPYCERMVESKRGLTNHIHYKHQQESASGGAPGSGDAVAVSDSTADVPSSATKTKAKLGDTVGEISNFGDSDKVLLRAKSDMSLLRWRLKECRVVLQNILPGGVGNSDVNELVVVSGGSKVDNARNSQDTRKRSAVVNEVGQENCVGRSGKEFGESDPFHKMSEGIYFLEDVVCSRKSSKLSCKKTSESPEKSNSQHDNLQVKDSTMAAEDTGPTEALAGPAPQSRSSEMKTGWVLPDSTKQDQPLRSRCIAALSDPATRNPVPPSQCIVEARPLNNTTPQAVISLRVGEDATRIPADQRPSIKTERPDNGDEEEAGPFPSDDKVDDEELNLSSPHCGCARTEVWPHLILKLKHNIESISDCSDVDEEGKTLLEEEGEMSADSVEEIPVEKATKGEKGSPSVSLPSGVGIIKKTECSTSREVEGDFSCTICGFVCSTREKMDEHVQTHPSIRQPFQCDMCSKRYTSKSHLQRHIRMVHAKGKFSCQLCGRMFTHKKKLTWHMKWHFRRDRFSCVACNKVFLTKKQLLEHSREHGEGPESWRTEEHHLEDQAVGPRMANLADAGGVEDSIPWPAQENQPEERGTGDWECRGPPGNQPRENEEVSKESLHGGVRADSVKQWLLKECPVTNERSSSGDEYHSKGWPGCQQLKTKGVYLCKVCGLSYQSVYAIQEHMKEHGQMTSDKESPMKVYKCPLCSKTFNRPTNLRSHMPSHSDEKPFCCPLCGKGFKWKKNVNEHLRTHVKDGWKPGEGSTQCDGELGQPINVPSELQTLFSCHLCCRVYHKKSSLKDHMKKGHPKFFQYNNYDKRFSQSSSLQKHTMVHSIPQLNETNVVPGAWLWTCHYCSSKFSDRVALQEHLKCHSGDGLHGEDFGNSVTPWHHLKKYKNSVQEEHSEVIDPGT